MEIAGRMRRRLVLAAGGLVGASACLGAGQVRRVLIVDGVKYSPEQLEAATESPVRQREARCSGSTCEVPRAMDGHFHIAGSVNGFPVVWVVDTGASDSCLPLSLARLAGIRAGVETVYETAGGRTKGAMSYGNEIGVGSMRISGCVVSLSPKLSTCLLGASAMERLQVRIEADTMRLSMSR